MINSLRALFLLIGFGLTSNSNASSPDASSSGKPPLTPLVSRGTPSHRDSGTPFLGIAIRSASPAGTDSASHAGTISPASTGSVGLDCGSPLSPFAASIAASQARREARLGRVPASPVVVEVLTDDIVKDIVRNMAEHPNERLIHAARFLYKNELNYCIQANLYRITLQDKITAKEDEAAHTILSFPGSITNRENIEAIRAELDKRKVYFSLQA